jgi:hypothetical protein
MTMQILSFDYDQDSDDPQLEEQPGRLGGRLCRPCADCGLMTGNFCDGLTVQGRILDNCFAEQRMPQETWSANQRTPFCSKCEEKKAACHFCLQTSMCQPPPTEVYKGDDRPQPEEAKNDSKIKVDKDK